MGLMDLFKKKSSGDVAKDRLKLLLVSDRASCSPEMMEQIKNEIKHVLDLEFRDNVKAHILQPDGTYAKQDKRGKVLVNSQMEFCREATEKAAEGKKEKKEKTRVFIPAEPAEDPEE